jgi:hypothetical protein
MKRLLPLLLSMPLLLTASLASAQTSTERRYELRPDPSWPLSIELTAGDYQIVSSEADSIAVVYDEPVPEKLKKVHVQMSSGHGKNYLKINGQKRGFHAIIQVPRKTDLIIRLGAGGLRVGDIEGNKDIEVHTGTLNFDALHLQDYGKGDLSAQMGNVTGPDFHPSSSRTSRSFETHGQGKYRLHAHVGIGDVALHSSSSY